MKQLPLTALHSLSVSIAPFVAVTCMCSRTYNIKTKQPKCMKFGTNLFQICNNLYGEFRKRTTIFSSKNINLCNYVHFIFFNVVDFTNAVGIGLNLKMSNFCGFHKGNTSCQLCIIFNRIARLELRNFFI